MRQRRLNGIRETSKKKTLFYIIREIETLSKLRILSHTTTLAHVFLFNVSYRILPGDIFVDKSISGVTKS